MIEKMHPAVIASVVVFTGMTSLEGVLLSNSRLTFESTEYVVISIAWALSLLTLAALSIYYYGYPQATTVVLTHDMHMLLKKLKLLEIGNVQSHAKGFISTPLQMKSDEVISIIASTSL